MTDMDQAKIEQREVDREMVRAISRSWDAYFDEDGEWLGSPDPY